MRKILTLLLISTNTFAQNATNEYPVAKIDTVKDIYFGQTVNDPYRWLENDTLSATTDWVTAETTYSNKYLRKLKNKYNPEPQLRKNSYYTFGTIRKSGIYYFDYLREGIDEVACLYIKKEIDGASKRIVDPADYIKDRKDKVSIKGIAVSADNKYLAFALSINGSDWHEIHVKTLYPFHDQEDIITGVKFSDVYWYNDGFFYIHYPMEGDVMRHTTLQPSVFYHKLGTEQNKDVLVYESGPHTNGQCFIQEVYSSTQNYLIIYEGDGEKTKVLSIALTPDIAQWKTNTIISSKDGADYNVIGLYNGKYLVRSTFGAPHGRLLLFDKNKQNAATEFIPEHIEVLEKASIVGNKVVCIYLNDIDNLTTVFDSTGTPTHAIRFETGCSVQGFDGSYDSPTTIFYQYSFLNPPIAYEYNTDYDATSLIKKTQVTYNFKEMEMEKVYYYSKDGTKIPMLLAHKKGIKMNGQNPTLLYGYGGYGVITTPFYDKGFISFIQNGGIVAIPCIRGGGEYGAEWHTEGKLLNKENVFDDFIAAAEFLFDKNYTCKDKLAIMGGSNGGLLVAAVMNKRPDICKAAVAINGVYDMLRYQDYTIGKAWEGEYGSVQNPAQFANLYHYSPIHNVKDTSYPAVLVVTSDHDDRVVPMHTYKYVATLQHKNTGDAPVLFYMQKNMGHQDQDIELDANIYSFIYDELDMRVHMIETQLVR